MQRNRSRQASPGAIVPPARPPSGPGPLSAAARPAPTGQAHARNVPRMPLRRLRSPRDGPTIWPPIAPRVPRPVPPRRASARKADSGTIRQACPRSQAEQAIDAPPATRAAGSGGDRSRPSRTPSRSTARGPNAAVLVPSSVSGAIADGTSFAQRSPRSRSPTAPPGTPPDPPGSRGPGYAPAVPRRAAPPDGRGKDRTEGSDPNG